MSQITKNSSLAEIRSQIAKLREQKGKEKETLQLIESAFGHGHEFMVNLFWEEALTYQHLVMNEDTKGEGKNSQVRLKNLMKMKDVVGRAKYYIVRFNLTQWKSRMYLFMGKVDDYMGNYNQAIKNYKSSMRHAKFDPETKRNNLPKYLEVEGRLAFSLIMSGKADLGYKLALKTYDKFETDENAIKLRKNDYFTWAVWKSGIVIRTITALLDIKSTIGKIDLKDWLDDAEKTLVPKRSFSYRLSEVKMLKKMLLPN